MRPVEIYHKRQVEALAPWRFEGITLKVYGLLARGKTLSDEMLEAGRGFVENTVLPAVEIEGNSNGLGFAIVHPGDLGLSISGHWWSQGSVLCQRFLRQPYDAATPLDTTTRPVIGCVWELDIINAETAFWRKTMMTLDPDPEAYVGQRVREGD